MRRRVREDQDDLIEAMLKKRLLAHGWTEGERKLGQRAWRAPSGEIVLEYDALKQAEGMPDEPPVEGAMP